MLLFGPIPSPRKKRAMNRCHQVFVTALHIQVMKAKPAVTKMVQRLLVSTTICGAAGLTGRAIG